MDQLPLFARLRDQPCLVVGGGEVAARKVRPLLAAGARVLVNAPELCPELAALAAEQRIEVEGGTFEPGLVARHLLVIAATSDRAVNHAVADAARAALRLCNVVDDPAASSWISPSVVDRSPIVVAVSSGGQAPVLARLVRQQLDRWLPRRLGELAGWAGRWRSRVAQRFPDQQGRRRFWERAFEGPLARHVLAGRTDLADADVARALAGVTETAPLGEAWLVGAGPGDPELLTLRGYQVLQQAEVILHDRLVAPELLAYARRDAELIDVGKTGGGPATDQAAINRLLVARVQAGQRVCRLKGGDPYVFGRGGEEAEALAAAGLPFQVIPGITAATGCGAYGGIPLTHRDQAWAVTLVSARRRPGAEPAEPDWAALAALGQTLVVYMATRQLGDIAAALIRHGRPGTTPAAVVAAGTLPAQRVVRSTLGHIAEAAAGLEPPTLLYVGGVAGLDERLAWFRGAAPAEVTPDPDRAGAPVP